MVKIGIIGAGFMGGIYAKAITGIPNAELTGIADVQIEKCKSFAREHGARAFASADALFKSGIDACAVCLPTKLHSQYTVKAAENGVHVLCEKPFASSVRDAEKMMEASKRNGVVLMIAHCLRFAREYNFLKSRIASGEYGALLGLRLFRHSTIPLWSGGNWLTDVNKSGGAALDLHIHDTDMLCYLLGPPQKVASSGGAYIINTMYGYRNGINISAEAGWHAPVCFPFGAGFDAVFENASISCINEKITLYEKEKAQVIDETELKRQKYFTGLSENFYQNEIRYFCDCVANGTQPSACTPESSLLSLKVVLSEIKSVKKDSSWQKIPQ